MIRGTVEYQLGDLNMLVRYDEEVRMVAGLVVEMMRNEPVTLLSPIMRKMAVERAERLEKMRLLLLNKLCIDNPGEPLEDQWPA